MASGDLIAYGPFPQPSRVVDQGTTPDYIEGGGNERIPVQVFADEATNPRDIDFHCLCLSYSGTGDVTAKMLMSAAATGNADMNVAIRQYTGSPTAAHTYTFLGTVTWAAPSTVGALGELTFTIPAASFNGVNGQFFTVRVRREGGDALSGIVNLFTNTFRITEV